MPATTTVGTRTSGSTGRRSKSRSIRMASIRVWRSVASRLSRVASSAERVGVETHLRRLFERFGLASRTELAIRALREGWLEVPPG